MLRIPGFIDIGTEISGGNWKTISRRAVKNGYVSLIAAPSDNEVYSEKAQFTGALEDASRNAVCDYAKLGLITPENIRTVEEWADEVPAALVNFPAFRVALARAGVVCDFVLGYGRYDYPELIYDVMRARIAAAAGFLTLEIVAVFFCVCGRVSRPM